MYVVSTKQFFFIVIILFPFFLKSQDNSTYHPLVSNAPIPNEFILSTTEKYEGDKKRISGTERKAQDEFYLENNFIIDNLLQSGSVLFNDPISSYINKVADELLKNDTVLRSKLRFYTVKSHIPNAFATDRGSIFVTIGLMARLNNEAELAYILSHEIVHFVKKHSLNSYVKFEAQQSKPWKQEPYYKRLVEKNNYSKELELEADELGLAYFKASKYSYEAIVGIFDILAFAHVPYHNSPFEKEFLEKEYFKFSEEYLLDTIPSITVFDDDDKNSTHPAISDRKGKLERNINKQSEAGRSIYLVGRETFNKVKKIAKFEICHTLVQNKSYQAAIYHAFLLSKEYPNNNFSQQILVYSLYGLAQYRNAGRASEVEFYRNNVQGELQQVFYMLHQLSDKDLSALATLHTWEYYKAHPKDKMYKKMAIDMAEDLVIYQVEAPENYFLNSIENVSAETKDTMKTDLSVYAFINWIKQEDLLQAFERGKKYRMVIAERKAFYETEQGQKDLITYQKNIRTNGKALGLDTVVFINPFYFTVKESFIYDYTQLQYIQSEKRQKIFKDIITKGGEALDIKTHILDLKAMSSETGIMKYQDIVTVNRWVKEMMNHDMEIIDYNYGAMLPLVEKYNTTAFAFTGAFSSKVKQNVVSGYIRLLSLFLLTPPLTPYAPELLFSWVGYSYFFTIVYDVEQNRASLEYVNRITVKDKNAILKANVFWAMQQMKHKTKAKSKSE